MKRLVALTSLAFSASVLSFAQDVPKADLFLGYSMFRANSAQGIDAFTMNGGVGTLGLNFNNHVALEFEFGGYSTGHINGYNLDTTNLTYLFGPRFSLGRTRRVDPYFHVLFGGDRLTTSGTPSQAVCGTCKPTVLAASQANFAMAAGGGLDVRLNRVLSLRPIQLDYLLTRFETINVANPSLPTQNYNQHNLRYSAGLLFNFGGKKAAPPPPPPPPPQAAAPPPPPQAAAPPPPPPPKTIGLGIGASPASVCAGSTATISPTAALPAGVTTQWTINGQPAGQGPTLQFATNGRNPGSYRIGLDVKGEGYNDASAQTTVTVLGYSAPTGTLNATPAEVYVGDRVTLNANFNAGQCGGTLRAPTFAASEGAVTGTQFDTTGVRFDPPGATEQRKTITITATAADDRGNGRAQTTVVVKQRAAAAARRLPDVVFPAGNARVNNCGKRVLLEELKTLTDNDPTGKVYLVGHTASREAAGLDQKRALNAAAVISAGSGICTAFSASQISILSAGSADNGVDYQPAFCGTSTQVAERRGQSVQENDENAKVRRVEVWFVPTGGLVPASVNGAQPATSLNVASLGCPR